MIVLLNIITTFLLLFWPMMFMMSPMAFDAPGSTNDSSKIYSLILILCYPIAIFTLYTIFNIDYFGFKTEKLLVISSVVILVLFIFFGYFSLLFNAILGIANDGYSVVNNKVYYDGKVIRHADPGSFIDLSPDRYSGDRYAKDNNRVYYRGKVIEGVSSHNLKILEIAGDTYLKNDSYILLYGEIIPDANPDTFSAFKDINNWTYSITNSQFTAYFRGEKIASTDQITFTPLNEKIAKDNNNIYKYGEVVLNEADAKSFELIKYGRFAKDKNYVYLMDSNPPIKIDGIDTNSVEVLERDYLKDKNHIYFSGNENIETINEADVLSFTVTGYDHSTSSEAKDKNNFYFRGNIIEPHESNSVIVTH